MTRFGTVAVAALAGAALAGCDFNLPSMDRDDAPRPRAQADKGLEVEAACPPPAEQACPPAGGETTQVVVKDGAGGEKAVKTTRTATAAKTAKTTRSMKTARAAKTHRTAKRHHSRADYGEGLAGGRQYQRDRRREYGGQYGREHGGQYGREYARAHPWEGRGGSYRHYEASPPQVRAYAYESREQSSESVQAFESEEHYGHSVVEGGAHGYHGGFDPRYEAYYTAGRDSSGYLVWPGKTP